MFACHNKSVAVVSEGKHRKLMTNRKSQTDYRVEIGLQIGLKKEVQTVEAVGLVISCYSTAGVPKALPPRPPDPTIRMSPQTRTTIDPCLWPRSYSDSLGSLQESTSTSSHRTLPTSIDDHHVPKRRSYVHFSSSLASVARHLRR